MACAGSLAYVVLSGEPYAASDLLAILPVWPLFLLFPALLFSGLSLSQVRFASNGSRLRWQFICLVYFGIAVLGHLAVLLLAAELSVGSSSSLLITLSNVVGYGLLLNLAVSVAACLVALVAMGVTYFRSAR